MTDSQATLTRKDFASDVQVKWCPGCGDYAILSAIQATMPHIGVPKENIVFISGIGCSSRFPHYMSTFGFHTIHGRAPAVATGLNLANPELSTWLITGDGDGLSIGGNHLLHAIKRNVNIKILLFNNNIYGLTKGQVSPTSQQGTVTKSTPLGSVDHGLNPLSFAISNGATFVARTMDKNPKHMQEVFKQASQHKGVAFIEILQNCVIFNDKVHDGVTFPKENHKDNMQLMLTGDNDPLIFGENKDKGVIFNTSTLKMEIVTIGENGITKDDLITLAQVSHSKPMQIMLAELKEPTLFGVFKAVQSPHYEGQVLDQISQYQDKKGVGDLNKLIHGGDTWVIK